MTMLETPREDGKVIICPQTDLVASTAPDFRVRAKAALAEGTDGLVVDLANVRMIDSTGIGALVAAHNSLNRTGGALEIVNTSPELLDLLRSLRLDQHFSISAASEGGQ